MTKIALYLAGGGARGAYQSGALNAICSILNTKKMPFSMLSGASIGSVNTAVLAEYALDFTAGTGKLDDLWANVSCKNIFKTNLYAFSKSFMANMRTMFFKQRLLGYILDTTPLREFISTNINFAAIEHAIQNQHLEIIEILSNCYETQRTISFYQHHAPNFEDWHYPQHSSQRVNLQVEYFLASTSLPLFFPPEKIDGFHYGDGHVGLESPLRGAIYCQVDKILVIGTRRLSDFGNLDHLRGSEVDFSRVLGGLINGIFIDNVDRDLDMIRNMNSLTRERGHPQWRPIQTLHLRPSVDIATIAQSQYRRIPILLRFLLNFLGATRHSGDLLSFLLFEKEFTRELMKLGFDDTMAQREAILSFFDAH